MDFDDLDELEDGVQKVREESFAAYVDASAIGGGSRRSNADAECAYVGKLSDVSAAAGASFDSLDPGAALVHFLARVTAEPSAAVPVIESLRPRLNGFLNFLAKSIGETPLDLTALRLGTCVNKTKEIAVHKGAMWLPSPGSKEEHPFPTHCIICFLTQLEALGKTGDADFAVGSVCFMPSAGGRRCMCNLDKESTSKSKVVSTLSRWARKGGSEDTTDVFASVPSVISSHLRFLAWFSEPENDIPRSPLDTGAMERLRCLGPGTIEAPELRTTWIRGPSPPPDDGDCGLLLVLHSAGDTVRHCKFCADRLLPDGVPYRSNLDVVLVEADYAWEPAMFPTRLGGPPRKGRAYFRFDTVFNRLGERLLSANRLLDFLEDYLAKRRKCKVDFAGFSIGATMIWTALLISKSRDLPCERAILLSPVLGDVWFATPAHITDRMKAIQFFLAWGEEEDNSLQEGKQLSEVLRGLSLQLKRYPGGHAMTDPELEDARVFLAKGRQ